ncbi:hypothetical protein CPC08DRAFT_713354 [Agrocybe pediades]|nr:hypothetical protein CPC08DRAFT_713354 [Agrocybe pediades]
MAPIRTGDTATPSNHRRRNPSTVTRRPQDDKRKKDALPGPANGQEQGFLRTLEMPLIRMDGLVGLPLEVAETLRYYENNPLSWIDEEPIWIGKNTIQYCTRCLPLRHALKVIDLERCSPKAMEFNRAYLNRQLSPILRVVSGRTRPDFQPDTSDDDLRPLYFLSAHSGNYFDAPYAGPSAGMPACHDGMPWCSGGTFVCITSRRIRAINTSI